MLFNSIEFLMFLPVVFLLYWFVFKKLQAQNLFIVIVSYIFYGWWDWHFLLLIAITSIFSFTSGVLMDRGNSLLFKKLICVTNIVLNLCILFVFKYLDFFAENFSLLLNSLGMEADWVTLDILLPVGISFYTFQALSYTIDVYRNKINPTYNIVAFTAFLSFFPQLVAGPIERATNLLPQFISARSFDYEKAISGCRQILWGFFKKMVIADNCSLIVNQIWDDFTNQNSFTLLIGAVLFTFQIYGDFSGYSDIAIGTAKLFGINLTTNFNYPYLSRNIADFWRRWHISLTTWFRDYIYIPLGGSRTSRLKIIRNTFIVFLVSGFWHGANWTFIVWGLYHALLFLPLMILGLNSKKEPGNIEVRFFPSIREFLEIFLTFSFVTIGWVIFRAENISDAYLYLVRLFTAFNVVPTTEIKHISTTFLFISILVVVEWLLKKDKLVFVLKELQVFSNPTVRRVGYCLFILFILINAGRQGTFIYFQF